ncbi:hypothetical protein [Paenibacillus macerans]|uniref:hypothetical protein n=1 Tax=Paenibacillus macerans TaxID=44252 RepID=UPI000EE746EF|nr:hypothetical protein [Paenibacillus macerans]GBK66268.1 hypothetical protein PbDSM24746_62720 [Paenibacillus macerans]GBK72550.1 hypothetical protein PbJCM17693_62580 [Paenibacillus macerans]
MNNDPLIEWFKFLDQITIGEWILWILAGIWALGTVVTIATDIAVAMDENDNAYSFTYFKKTEYKVYDIFLVLLAIPAWVLEGVIFLLSVTIFAAYRLLNAALNVTIFKRKTEGVE